MIPFILETDRLLLSIPTTDDVDAITEYLQEPEMEKFLTIPWPYNRSHAEFFVSQVVTQGWALGTELIWALRPKSEASKLLGVVTIRQNGSDIGYWLGRPHRGRGYMREAVLAVLDWVYDSDYLAGQPVAWEAIVGNSASRNLAESCGFEVHGVRPASVPHRDGSRPDAWWGAHRRAH